jgi:hypothetical protein
MERENMWGKLFNIKTVYGRIQSVVDNGAKIVLFFILCFVIQVKIYF